MVEPSGAIPQDQIKTDDDARGMEKVSKVEMMVIFEESVTILPSFVFANPL